MSRSTQAVNGGSQVLLWDKLQKMNRKKLPIGIQTFREIIEDGHYYVDKTSYALQLIEQGKYYFLSRPRRFGKSLFVDTLKELFEGNQALFMGLAAENRWDWNKKHPVIRISFAVGVFRNRTELDQRLYEILLDHQNTLGVQCQHHSLGGQFEELLALAHRKTGQRVVVLVDEYDKPILDNLENRDAAIAMREGLKNFYSVLKGADQHIRFLFMTGVSKFSKVSLFSGLNNLIDITLESEYSDLCGYTDDDIDTVFATELPTIDRIMLRDWYNGYNWLGRSVYNPFCVLQLFRTKKYHPHWFGTGTPEFVIKLLRQRQQFTPDLSRMVASSALLSTFDVDDMPLEALLFQTGYLTVDSCDDTIPGQLQITLKYPNKEVQSALNTSLLQGLTGNHSAPVQNIHRLHHLLKQTDWEGLKILFQAFYASIANDWYRKNNLDSYEGYYVSIFYSYFAALGFYIKLEDPTNLGRIDMTVIDNGQVYLFEFKVVDTEEPQGKALQQIKNKGYAEKYQNRGERIHLVGVEFSKISRNIVGWEWETLP
ncbi:ATP-binding protein [Candidatus Symbiobacter mobilis]|uniref:AAA-ATPase-like domain-containing protein n=1 Tax=Candidatus Symbiobacter mobilis CR TaxID=946483 RepID=U5N7M2_9BURK|nr:ATP-binding protein [Candidatus Symbiobacter mobilis]AGX87536.1 hypothetical protein Cenrod_1450 [Candidatus Symbiobacter mobilis CR]